MDEDAEQLARMTLELRSAGATIMTGCLPGFRLGDPELFLVA